METDKPLKILLIAYEFPPGPSPQSLRWARLARELRAHGDDVHVLTVARGEEPGRLDVPEGVRVHRVGASLVFGAVESIRRIFGRSRPTAVEVGRPAATDAGPAGARGKGGGHSGEAGHRQQRDVPAEELNWKGRMVVSLDRAVVVILSRMLGARWISSEALWGFLAKAPLLRLLEEFRPDVVISSHEPDVTLRLGLISRQRGFPWLADLGDPVLSAYTPARRRRRAGRIERATCLDADHLTVTTEATRELLVSRHGVERHRFSVLPQGYDAPAAAAPGVECPVELEERMLELVYTGSFYAFRHPRGLVEAVLEREGVRLTVATRTPPDWLIEVADARPDRIRLLGFLPHDQALALQRSADVLVNIANDDPVQLPGKLFEYLGAGRPILHIGEARGLEFLLGDGCRGLVAGNDTEVIGHALDALAEIKRSNTWHREFDLDGAGFAGYEWKHIALRLRDVLVRLADASAARELGYAPSGRTGPPESPMG
jgi:glycosyltransferase involved in cell wall biosynthesis